MMTIGTKVNCTLNNGGGDVERCAIIDITGRDRVLMTFDGGEDVAVSLPFVDLMDALNVLHERRR